MENIQINEQLLDQMESANYFGDGPDGADAIADWNAFPVDLPCTMENTMENIQINEQLLDQLESANYFGDGPDASATRLAWESAFPVDLPCTMDRDEFERVADQVLTAVCNTNP